MSVRDVIQAAAGNSADSNDPYWSNVSLLLDGDGTDGSQSIADRTGKNTITASGNARISTSVKKYGTGSLYFDGNGDFLTTSSADGFNASLGNWTVEAWMYCTNSAQNDTLITGNESDFYMAWIGTDFYLGDGYLNNLARIANAKPTNQWFHVACVKNGSSYTAYINGVSIGSTTIALSNKTLSTWKIGYYSGSTGYMAGYIDDLRITKGIARYTTNFTPPAQALPTK